jgi:hypothetical protein
MCGIAGSVLPPPLHRAYRAHRHTWLWALLMLELWFRTWIDGASPSDAYHPAA